MNGQIFLKDGNKLRKIKNTVIKNSLLKITQRNFELVYFPIKPEKLF